VSSESSDAASQPSWTIALPSFNEEENLAFVLDDLLTTFAEIGAPFRAIVLDDGSRDRTGAIADEYAGRHPQIEVIHHETNKGFGAALAAGYAAATGDLVVLIPTDRQFRCQDLKQCLPLLPDHDVVICVRRDRSDPFARRVASASYRFLMRLLFGLDVDDINWVKIYRLEMLRRIEIESEGPFIDTEILVKARHMGARITEVDVPHYPRVAGRATGAGLRAMIKTFVDLFRLQRRLARIPRAQPGGTPSS
jgi:glycosyltransferase involved in cell wall biosynthesis